MKIAKTNKKKYIILDTSKDIKDTESIIYNKIKRFI